MNIKFDGDVMSMTYALTDESITEVSGLMNSKHFYVGVSGESTFSSSNPISDLLFAEMTA